MAKFLIGTAGWSYKDWDNCFYPALAGDKLEFYSKWFNTVEVNSTYYTYLTAQTAESWLRKVEAVSDFLFTVKLHADFTHKRNYTVKEIKSFLSVITPLYKADRLGQLLIQFPYSFSFNSATQEYVRKLVSAFEQYENVIEVRHSSWSSPEAIEFLDGLNLSVCIIDQPEIGKAITFNPFISNDILYVRLHGRNIEGWHNSITNFGKEQTYEEQSDRYKYLYSPGELNEMAQQIKELENKVKEVHVIMNNHPLGYAPANAFEMIKFLERKSEVEMPDTITKAFGRLKMFAKEVPVLSDMDNYAGEQFDFFN